MANAFSEARCGAYNRKGEYDRAIWRLRSGHQGRPNYAEAFVDASGVAYLSKGQYDRAIQDFDRAIQTNAEARPCL